jgi:hypothetical protein
MAQAIRRLHQDAGKSRRMAVNARAAGLVYDRRKAVDRYQRMLAGVCP